MSSVVERLSCNAFLRNPSESLKTSRRGCARLIGDIEYMAAPAIDSTPQRPRRPARDIIDAVVDNMRKNLEPLKYSTLAASRYTVYLHPSEYARLEGIVPILREQTVRALTEELQKLNRGSLVQRWVDRAVGRVDPQIQSAGSGWQVDFLADPDGDMGEGDLLVDSELLLPSSPDLGVGARTRRVTTVHTGSRTTTREQTIEGTGFLGLMLFAIVLLAQLVLIALVESRTGELERYELVTRVRSVLGD